MYKFKMPVVCFLLLGFISHEGEGAQACKVNTVKEIAPDVFKNSNIKRRLKNGKIQEFDGDSYKIVPRKQLRKICKPKIKTKEVVKVVERVKETKNNLSLLVGNGPSDSLKYAYSSVNSVNAKSGDENFLGIGYTRDVLRLSESTRLSIGGFYLTNETIGASLGVSW